MHTPWNSFLRKPWVGNFYSTIVICRKLAGVRPMYTSTITITWMAGGIRDGPRPISTPPTAVNTFSNIEQGVMVDIFRPTFKSWTITPTISYWGVRLSGMGPIPNSLIITNSISWKSQQYTILTLVIGVTVAGMRPISTSPFNTKSCPPIARGRVAGLLWNISTPINISSVITGGRVAGKNWPTTTAYMLTWGRVGGLKRPMSTTLTTSVITWVRGAGLKVPMSNNSLSWIHLKKFFFRTFIVVVTIAGGIMGGITRLRS